mmetsp:Transcript_78298/g.247464  ORF Transcript_78298/g.247464 Transcript_78298/m.247464 type:complete len:310 (+) Transcript_78298:1050-1979(+)
MRVHKAPLTAVKDLLALKVSLQAAEEPFDDLGLQTGPVRHQEGAAAAAEAAGCGQDWGVELLPVELPCDEDHVDLAHSSHSALVREVQGPHGVALAHARWQLPPSAPGKRQRGAIHVGGEGGGTREGRSQRGQPQAAAQLDGAQTLQSAPRQRQEPGRQGVGGRPEHVRRQPVPVVGPTLGQLLLKDEGPAGKPQLQAPLLAKLAMPAGKAGQHVRRPVESAASRAAEGSGPTGTVAGVVAVIVAASAAELVPEGPAISPAVQCRRRDHPRRLRLGGGPGGRCAEGPGEARQLQPHRKPREWEGAAEPP